jgi:hypothetical protein
MAVLALTNLWFHARNPNLAEVRKDAGGIKAISRGSSEERATTPGVNEGILRPWRGRSKRVLRSLSRTTSGCCSGSVFTAAIHSQRPVVACLQYPLILARNTPASCADLELADEFFDAVGAADVFELDLDSIGSG